MRKYKFTESSQGKVFKFLSIGPKGVIKKVVQFQEIEPGKVYNAAIADEVQGSLHYERQSNNGDILIIFSTLTAIVERFCFLHPEAIIFITSNDQQRINVYQWRLKRALQELKTRYTFFGQTEDGASWEAFQESKFYTAFFVVPIL